MTDFIAAVFEFGRRRRRYVLGFGASLALAAGLLLSTIPFESDVLELIPQGGPAVRSFQTFVRRFDSLDYVFVLFEAPEGRSIGEYEDLVDSYVAELRAAPEISYVDSLLFDAEKDWNYLLDRVLLLLGPEAFEENFRKFDSSNLDDALLRARETVGIPSPAMQSLVRRDPLGFTFALRESFAGNKAFAQFDPSAEGYVSADGRSRLVIAKPVAPPYDAEFSHRLMDVLGAIETRARGKANELALLDDPLPSAAIEIAGPYRDHHEAESQIRSEMKRNVFGSLVLLLAFVLLVFRSQWVLLCSTLTLGLAGLLAMAVVGLYKGNLLAASSGGAAMLFGLGIDGIMLLYVRYLEERARGLEFAAATPRLSVTAKGVLLGNVTTVATFAALIFVDFPSLEELGRLVAVGMIFCAALTLLFVPALLAYRPPVAPRWSLQLVGLAEMVESRSATILWAAGALTLASLLLLPRIEIVTTIEKIQPQTPGRAAEEKLQTQFGFAKDVLLVLTEGRELEPMLEKHLRLRAALARYDGGVSVASALSFLPTVRQQAEVANAIASARLNASELSQRFANAAADAGFRPGAFDPFLASLPVLLDPDERITYAGLVGHGLDSVVSRFIASGSEGFAVTTYVYPSDAVGAEKLAEDIKTLDSAFSVTGHTLVTAELREAFPPQFIRGIVIGTVAVCVLIYAGFRSVRLTLFSMLPTVLGLLWSGALFALVGFELDMFSAFGVVMVIGIGVDYGIHILHRSEAGEANVVREFLPFTGAAVALAAMTTTIGFGSLAFSSYRPLGALGIAAAVSVVLVALASLLVLPALLTWRGR